MAGSLDRMTNVVMYVLDFVIAGVDWRRTALRAGRLPIAMSWTIKTLI